MIQYDPKAMALVSYREGAVQKMAAAEIARVVNDVPGWKAAKVAQLLLERAREAEQQDPEPPSVAYACCLGCRLAGGHS